MGIPNEPFFGITLLVNAGKCLNLEWAKNQAFTQVLR